MSQPVITLLSGLGLRDASVSVAKAVLMGYAPAAAVIDISHSVGPGDLQMAAYLLLSAYRHFPKGAIHVLPVDVFAGSPSRVLLAEKDGYYFIAPDNGVLSLAFERNLPDTLLCHEFSRPFFFSEWLHSAGRAIGAVLAGNLTAFTKYASINVPRLQQPRVMRDFIDCSILYVDRYENVVLDMTLPRFDELIRQRPFRIKLMRMDDITAVSNNYNDVPPGKPLCRFNSAGFLEIAFNHGKAATMLGLDIKSDTGLRYQAIKIFTENTCRQTP